MKIMIYDAQFFIDKFSAIPENKWIIGDQGEWGGSCCALGHTRMKPEDEYGGSKTEEGRALLKLFIDNGLTIKYDYGFSTKIEPGPFSAVACINNGTISKYPQPTPKQRILAALYDIKALQNKNTGAKRERIVYVAVPETIKEQASELVNLSN